LFVTLASPRAKAFSELENKYLLSYNAETDSKKLKGK
jgi:hypothetical protein